MPPKRTSKVPRKPNGKIDWKAYDEILMGRWKEKLDVRWIKKNGKLLIRITEKIK